MERDTLPVTADNFTRAETDTYFANIVKQAVGCNTAWSPLRSTTKSLTYACPMPWPTAGQKRANRLL